MQICPKCRTVYPDPSLRTCPKDGMPLVDSRRFADDLGDPLLGATIAQRFQVHSRLGVGGMGTVYRAEQAGLNRTVALKVLKRELVSDRETVERFKREARSMSKLVHPNTVRVFDFGEDTGGHLYLAMELLEGETLTEWLKRVGEAPMVESVNIIRAILKSLTEAHSKGIVHRDLKPDNIFLSQVDGRSDPIVKVLDFGIAKVFRGEEKIDQLETQAGTVFGTPRYMSPEQAQGRDLDHRSDLYAVGVLLYQLITGAPPYVDDDAVVVMAKHIQELPVAPRRAVPDRPIPRRLERTVLTAMAKKREQRWASAEIFERELQQCLPDIAAEIAFRERQTGKISAPLRRLPRGPMLTGALIVALSMGIAAALQMHTAADDDNNPFATTLSNSNAPANGENESALNNRVTTVQLQSTPAGASIIREGGIPDGVTPREIEIDGSSITLRLEGYHDRAITLAPNLDHSLPYILSPHEMLDTATSERATQARRTAPTKTPRPRPNRPTSPTAPVESDPYERFD